MLALAVPFVAAFALVALRAWQQRNVQAARYGSMFFTSFAWAFVEAVVVVAYVANGPFHIPTIVAIGAGGGLGGVVAVKLSKRLFHD